MQIIPKNKHDLDICKNLFEVSDNTIVENIDELLEWTEDINWPVARCIYRRVKKVIKSDIIVKKISDILNSKDSCHKYAILVGLLNKLLVEEIKLFKDDLKHLATNPSKNDKLEEIDILAIEMLKGF